MNWNLFVRGLSRSYRPAWIVLLLGVTLTLLSSTRLREQSRAADQARFERAVRQTVAAIQDGFRRYEMAASATADFFAAREDIAQPEWRFRIQMLANEQNYPGLLEAGYAELEPGLSNAASWRVEANLPAIPFRVDHAWAREPSAMSGVDPDFLADPGQAAAAWHAIQTASPALSDLRELSAEIQGEPARGFSIFAPVFSRASILSASTPGSRDPESYSHHGPPRGVSFCAVEPGLMLEALFGEAPREVNFELFSAKEPAAVDWLNPSAKSSRALDNGFQPYLRTNLPFQVLNRTWSIHCYTTPLFEREASLAKPWLILPLGLGLTFALTGLLAIQIHARIRQDTVVAELRSTCDELHDVQSERERVSRDLHDGAIQSLYLLQLSLGRCERLFHSNATQARELLSQGKYAIDDLISELRRFLLQDEGKASQPVKFEEAYAVLHHLVERLRKTESITVKMTGSASAPVLMTLSQVGHLKQIAQEAMSNCVRHSHAKAMTLELSVSNSMVAMVVTDDGRGFDPHRPSGTGNGLANMQARASHLGGNLRFDSCPGQGTSVTLVFHASSMTESQHEQTCTN
jgi:signal transduction histidine kinase